MGLALTLGAACTVLAQPRGEAIVYDGPNLNGRSHHLRGEVANFEKIGFNDRTSSIRVVSGTWEFCTDAHFQGRCKSYTPGEYRHIGKENRISSARLVHVRHQARIRLYENRDFGGQSFTLDQSAPNFEPHGFNDRTRSFVIEHGHWRICSDAYGKGHCEEFGPGRYGSLPHGLRGRVSSAYLK